MARLVVFDGFIDARNRVRSERIRKNVDAMLMTIEQMPGVGSSLLPESIVAEFGTSVRKAVVSPIEIVYEYDEATDTAYVYDLLYCPNVT